MSDPQPQTAATGTLTVRYRSGELDFFHNVPATRIHALCGHFDHMNQMERDVHYRFATGLMPDGRAIIINLTEVASSDFIPDDESNEERWARQNREAREEFAKVATHLPRATEAAL